MARRPLPSLTGLRAFEAFARLGSMTGAASELCITHGAVSRQVRALEVRLGVRLVVGPRHDLVLTDAGRQLAAALTPAFDMVAAALPGAGPDRELVVSCLGTLAMKWLIPRLPDFHERHPGVRVRILESHAPVDFSQGGLHAAIRIEHSRPAEGIRSTPFMPLFHGPVLAPSLLAEIGDDLPRLLTLPRLHTETRMEAWEEWAGRAQLVLPPARLERQFEHNSYMLEAAAAGLGVGIAPWAFAAPDVERGRLAAPFGFEPVNARFVFLRPRLADNPTAEAFGAWLQEQGAQTPMPGPPVRLP
ncbi:LysR substrate-binding domain-containing protein [Phenylobacterium deserti]|uniref:LysR family transcriptional regulator n=1 Tax=Phenylobacterium deserti TaxID=1914756 RepID=A0A328AQ35_9CAUL|nr:LysR substrate-binding domain-containing protein [Phenylobacterium deserti]RAK57123.1 LysR family transcriptional regulator [Phenylobacterium deserti]